MSPLLNIFKASHRDVNFILYCLFLIHLLFVLLYALFFVFSPFTGFFVFLCNSRSLRKKVAYFLLAFKERKILYQRFLFLKMFRMFGHKNQKRQLFTIRGDVSHVAKNYLFLKDILVVRKCCSLFFLNEYTACPDSSINVQLSQKNEFQMIQGTVS